MISLLSPPTIPGSKTRHFTQVNCPLPSNLQALASFAETGNGNPTTAQRVIAFLLSRLFAAPYHPDGLEHIPGSLWLQSA